VGTEERAGDQAQHGGDEPEVLGQRKGGPCVVGLTVNNVILVVDLAFVPLRSWRQTADWFYFFFLSPS
jgi:hypothetical protein